MKDVILRVVTTPKELREWAEKLEHHFAAGLTDTPVFFGGFTDGVDLAVCGNVDAYEDQIHRGGKEWS